VLTALPGRCTPLAQPRRTPLAQPRRTPLAQPRRTPLACGRCTLGPSPVDAEREGFRGQVARRRGLVARSTKTRALRCAAGSRSPHSNETSDLAVNRSASGKRAHKKTCPRAVGSRARVKSSVRCEGTEASRTSGPSLETRSLGLGGFLDQARVEVLLHFQGGLVYAVLHVELVDDLARAVNGVEAVSLGVVLDVLGRVQ